jgi:hypothetical protein
MIIEKKLASFEQSNEVGSSFFAALVISIELHNKEQRVNPFPNQSRSSKLIEQEQEQEKGKGKYKTKNQNETQRSCLLGGIYSHHNPSILPYQSVIDSQRSPLAGLQHPNTQRKPNNRSPNHTTLQAERNTSVATLLGRNSTTGPAGIAVARLRVRNLRRSSNGSLESAGG